MMLRTPELAIAELIESFECDDATLELWGYEHVRAQSHQSIRVFIEASDGITADLCARVSSAVSRLLAEEFPVLTDTPLEVSSPGVNRKFFNIEQLDRYQGYNVQLSTLRLRDTRKRFSGRLVAVDTALESFTLDCQETGEVMPFVWNELASIKLLPEWKNNKKTLRAQRNADRVSKEILSEKTNAI